MYYKYGIFNRDLKLCPLLGLSAFRGFTVPPPRVLLPTSTNPSYDVVQDPAIDTDVNGMVITSCALVSCRF